MNNKPIYLTAAYRTAIGSFQGSLSNLSAIELGTNVVSEILTRTKVPKDSINEIVMGCILTGGLGQAPARQVAIKAGLSESTQAMTINKVCSSGLKAVMLAAQSIELGYSSAAIAGGMESMTNAPYLLPNMRSGARLGHATAEDSMIKDALWDVYNDFHMGNCAEICAKEYNLSREIQDKFAIESYNRANESIKAGYFKEEIIPLKIKVGKEEVEFSTDEEPGKGNIAKIPTLRPVFQKDGTVTAANASSINDGACAMIVCDEEYLKKYNLKPLARILSLGFHAQKPEWFTTAPVGAVNMALKRANKTVDQIDLFEVNEAFSAVALACQNDLKIDPSKLNIQGGAVALGHPVGASGARILTTLLYSLKRTGKKLGACGICNGGGEATAMVVEAIS